MNKYKPFTPLQLVYLFFKYSKQIMKSTLEYKMDKSLLVLAVFVRESVNVTIMILILKRFVRIKGWEMNELLFLYSFLFVSYSLCIFFFTGIRDFSNMVRTGEFDRYLVRPLGLMFQIISSKVDYPAFIGHGTIGIVLFLKVAASIGINWNLYNIIYCIVVLAGGTIIQASIMLISTSFSFWAVNTTNIRNLVFFNCRRFAGYPISFYPAFIQKILIYVVPFAFVNYFPTNFFLKKPETFLFWEGFLYLTPVVGVILFSLSIFFWRYGLKCYTSTGN